MNRCYYTHEGQTHGPIERADLRQLAEAGQLLPDDRVWAENMRPDQAVEASLIVDFATLAPAAPAALAAPVAPAAPAAPAAPDWLTDVAQAEAARPPKSFAPDWLASVAEVPVVAAAPGLDVEWMPPLLPPSSGACRLSVGGATSCGLARLRNEDHFLTQQLGWSSGEEVHEATLLVVADGMGGEKAGDRASALVISTLAAELAPVLAGLLRKSPQEASTAGLTQALAKALRQAHTTIYQTAEGESAASEEVWFDAPRRRQAGSGPVAEGDPSCKGMGSTAAVALVHDGQVVISHVGDCRVYHQRGDTLTQVTTDHTLVARMVELGKLTPEEAANHPASNQVTQALGKKVPLQPSQHELTLQRGDWLIIACDGLAAHVEKDEVCATAQRAVPSAGYLAKRLVELANEGGGTDNCTVVAAYCY